VTSAGESAETWRSPGTGILTSRLLARSRRWLSRAWPDQLPPGPAVAANLLPPLAFVVISLGIAWPVVTHLGQRVPGAGDGVLFSWYFEWIAQAVSHGHNPFVSAALNAPAGVNVMWNTAVFLLALVCIPFTLSVGAFTTVALAMVLSPAISGATAYWVLRRLSGRTIGAVIGAAVYAYGPFMTGEFAHLHLLFAPIPPLLLLVGHRLVISQQGSPIRVGLLFGLLIGLQVLLSEELLALSIVAGAIALLWLVVLNPQEVRPRARYALTGAGIALATAVPIVAVPLGYQFFGPDSLKRFLPETARADLASFVRPSLLQYYSSRADVRANLTFPANGAENTGYLGWPLIIAALAVCIWYTVRRERFAIWWLLTALSVAALMLGSPIDVNGHATIRGPWALVRRLPLMGGALAVRFSLMMLLLVAGLIAWTLARLHGRALVAGVLVAVAVLIPLRPVVPIHGSLLPPTPRFFTTSAVDVIPRGAVTAVLPQAGFPHNEAMVWQVRTHLRFNLVGGYSVFRVHNHATYVADLPPFINALREVGRGDRAAQPVAALRSSARDSGVTYLVITAFQPNMRAVVAAAAAITGCHPRKIADVLLCQIRTGSATPSGG